MFFFSLRIKWHAFNEYAKCEYKKLLDQKKKEEEEATYCIEKIKFEHFAHFHQHK